MHLRWVVSLYFVSFSSLLPALSGIPQPQITGQGEVKQAMLREPFLVPSLGHGGLWPWLQVSPQLPLWLFPITKGLGSDDGDSWNHDLHKTWIKCRVGCASPALLYHPGLPEYSSKIGSRLLETFLGALDDLGVFGAWPSAQHSTILCFTIFVAVRSIVVSSVQSTGKVSAC